MKRWIIVGVLLVFGSVGACARHIIGGDIALIKRGTANNDFNIILTLIYDDAIGISDENAFVSFFRKSTHGRVEDFTLNRTLKQELPYLNAACVGSVATSRITLVRYVADITLASNNYNDPQGYYLAWEECCRNGNILNIQTPSRVGLVFYAEIPSLNTPNSSAEFKTPEVNYVCAGKNFEADFSAKDVDNDELRYALVTPLIGSTDGSGTFPTKAKQGPYRRALWSSGFDSTKIILGVNPLTINAKTGKITLNTSQLGVFAFAVRCEEWRNGIKIGEVRREFVLNVVDCKSILPEPVSITLKQAGANVTFETNPNGHVTTIRFCQGDSAILKADDEDPKWAYQWLLDGKHLQGATKTTLSIKQTGSYVLVKKFAQGCSAEDSTSNVSLVTLKSTPKATITSSRPLPLCEGDSTNLSVESGTHQIIWQKNGINLAITNNLLPRVKEAGVYSVIITDATSKCTTKDSINIKIVAGPAAPLSLSGTPIFCANDSVKLLTPKKNGYEYVWFLADFPLVQAIENFFYPQKSGRYSLVVVDALTQCATHSAAFDIIVKPSPTVSLDSIPPLCTTGLQAISLVGTPAGGIFSGLGVVGNRFITQNLTAGSYPITYTYTNTEGCAAKAVQWARLSPPPRIEVSKSLVVLRGDSVQLKTQIPPNSTVQWFPSIGLNNPLSTHPTASPDRTTNYKITIITKEGCVATAEVLIAVIDLKIPNGFTPNGDGFNDTWEITGIKDYPNCTIEIFNRWGNVVFTSKGYETPWDGQWDGQQLPIGIYYYHIYLRDLEYKLTGSINIMR